MIAYWPEGLPQRPRRGTWTGGPKEARRVFQPDIGGPIMRAGSTSDVMIYSGVVFPNLQPAQRVIFEGFWQQDLGRGNLPFCWREPENDTAGLWLIAAAELAYTFTSKGAGLSDLQLTLVRKPGSPWFAPYLQDGSSKPPYVVADYTNGVFGIDCLRATAAQVALVAGTYDLVTTKPGLATLVETSKVVVAGDIPATAPVGVSQIIGYQP